jgi:hypothetical protein
MAHRPRAGAARLCRQATGEGEPLDHGVADNVLDDPVSPEMSPHGLAVRPGTSRRWGRQCLDWAKRVNFTGKIGLHVACREEFINVDVRIPTLSN